MILIDMLQPLLHPYSLAYCAWSVEKGSCVFAHVCFILLNRSQRAIYRSFGKIVKISSYPLCSEKVQPYFWSWSGHYTKWHYSELDTFQNSVPSSSSSSSLHFAILMMVTTNLAVFYGAPPFFASKAGRNVFFTNNFLLNLFQFWLWQKKQPICMKRWPEHVPTARLDLIAYAVLAFSLCIALCHPLGCMSSTYSFVSHQKAAISMAHALYTQMIEVARLNFGKGHMVWGHL